MVCRRFSLMDMNTDKFLLKKISTGKDFFLFNGNKGKVLKVNSELYENVSAILNKEFMSGDLVPHVENLYKSEILSDIYSTPYENIKDSFIDSVKNQHILFTPESLCINNIGDITDINSVKKSILYYSDNLSPSKLITIEIYGELPDCKSSVLYNIIEFCSSLPCKFQFILHTSGNTLTKNIVPFLVFHNFYINVKSRHLDNPDQNEINLLEDNLSFISEYDYVFFSNNIRLSASLLKYTQLSRMFKANSCVDEDIKLLLNIKELIALMVKSERTGKCLSNRKMFITKKNENLRQRQKRRISYNAFIALKGLTRIHFVNNRDEKGNDNLFAENMSHNIHINGDGKFYLKSPCNVLHNVGNFKSGIDHAKLLKTQNEFAAAKIENCYKCWVKNMCRHSVSGTLQSIDSDFCLQERITWKNNLDLYSRLLSEYGYEKVNTIVNNFRIEYLLYSSI